MVEIYHLVKLSSYEFAFKEPDKFLDMYHPHIMKAVGKYSGSGVDKGILEAKAEALAFKAANSFNPDKGVQFETHLYNNLMGLYRTVNSNQGIARLSENKKLDYSKNPESEIYSRKQSHQSGLGDSIGNEGVHDSTFYMKKVLAEADLSPTERRASDFIMGHPTEPTNLELAQHLGVSAPRATAIKKQISLKIGPKLNKELHYRKEWED